MTGGGDVRASAAELDTSQGPSDLGRYQVFATLGRGGMAEVFLAVARGPRGFNKLVVLKRLRPHLAEEESFRAMFLDEARLAARLNHPNVVQSYEVGEGHGSYFITMEYLDGQPLNRLVEEAAARGRPIETRLAVRIIAEACAGLAYAHELRDYDGTSLRIIHRDVSPHNVFVNYDGQVKLVDFGIAKAAVSQAETEVGVLKGKLAYMAPEQATGDPLDSRADIFAMGIILWELLTGRALFTGENAAHTLQKLVNEPIPTPSSVLPEGRAIDPKLEAIVMRTLARDPAARMQSARELRTALEDWLGESSLTVRSDDVEQLMTSLFEGTRTIVQGEIQKQMAAFASGGDARPMTLSSLDAMERAGQNVHAALLDLRPVAGGATSGMNRKVLPAPAEPSRRGAIGVVLLLLFACVVAVIGFLFLRAEQRGASAPVASASAAAIEPSPTPSVTAALAAPAPVPAASATVAAASSPEPEPAPATPTSSHGRGAVGHTVAAHAGHSSRPTSTPTAASSDPPGFLTLDTYPWTRVSENGRVLGTTPIVHLALSPGSHTLVLENTDLGIRQNFQALIASGATVTRRVGLR